MKVLLLAVSALALVVQRPVPRRARPLGAGSKRDPNVIPEDPLNVRRGFRSPLP